MGSVHQVNVLAKNLDISGLHVGAIRVSSRGQGATRRPEGSRGPRGKPGR